MSEAIVITIYSFILIAILIIILEVVSHKGQQTTDNQSEADSQANYNYECRRDSSGSTNSEAFSHNQAHSDSAGSEPHSNYKGRRESAGNAKREAHADYKEHSQSAGNTNNKTFSDQKAHSDSTNREGHSDNTSSSQADSQQFDDPFAYHRGSPFAYKAGIMLKDQSLIITALALILLLLGCMAHRPYELIILSRFGVTVGFLLLAWGYSLRQAQRMTVTTLAIAALFQPFSPLPLERGVWLFIDVIIIIALVIEILHLCIHNLKSAKASDGNP